MPKKVKEILIDLFGKTYQAVLVGFVISPFVTGKFDLFLVFTGSSISIVIFIYIIILSYSLNKEDGSNDNPSS